MPVSGVIFLCWSPVLNGVAVILAGQRSSPILRNREPASDVIRTHANCLKMTCVQWPHTAVCHQHRADCALQRVCRLTRCLPQTAAHTAVWHAGRAVGWQRLFSTCGNLLYLASDKKSQPALGSYHIYDKTMKNTLRKDAVKYGQNIQHPSVWISLNSYTVDCGSVAVLESRLKIFLFHQTFRPTLS